MNIGGEDAVRAAPSMAPGAPHPRCVDHAGFVCSITRQRASGKASAVCDERRRKRYAAALAIRSQGAGAPAPATRRKGPRTPD